MFRVDARKPVHFCDGLTRRDFLHAGSLTALGLGLPAMQGLAKPGRGAGSRHQLHPAIPGRRPVAARHLGHEARCSRGDPRAVPADRDQGARGPGLGDLPQAGHDDGQGGVGPLGLSHGGGRPRHRAPDDADRATLHRRDRPSAVWLGTRQAEGSRQDTPPYVLLPKPIGPTGGNLPHGHAAGYLGKTFDPFILNADPNDKAFKVPDLLPPDYVTAVSESRRRSLRSAIDGAVGAFESSADARLLDANFEGAFKLMSSPKAREAFDIAAEPDSVRDRYGRTRFGQSCLLARRLVERGVRFVTVNMFETVFNEITWDIHGSAPFSPIECYKNEVGPNFDNAYTALLEDLEAPGDARDHDGAGVRRVRRHPQDQSGRRPRPSPGLLDGPLRRRIPSRAGASSAPPTRSATPPRIDRSPPPRSPRPSITASGSTSRPSCPAPRAVRSASSTTASSRSRNCSDTRVRSSTRIARNVADERRQEFPIRLRFDDRMSLMVPSSSRRSAIRTVLPNR